MVVDVSSRILLGIVVLSCIQSVRNENVDINTLSRIQSFIHYNYETGQYAAAINVPPNQCRSGFRPSRRNFLTRDKSVDVKPFIQPFSNAVYWGHELIAAGWRSDAHSEFLLMNPTNNSPLTDLMNRRNDGCVVFYTLNTPCLRRCLNVNNWQNILQGVGELSRYRGMKAFVFTYVYHNDLTDPNLGASLRLIADRVPLYRCTRDGCVLCAEPGSNAPVLRQCLNP